MRWLYYWVVLLLLVVAAIYATLWSLEDTMLLHPAVCRSYLSYDPSSIKLIPLRSGGLLMHCHRNQDLTGSKPILCLHGNAGNLDGMANLSRLLLDRSYDVYLLEPAGYGVCGLNANGCRVKPTTEGLVTDLQEAWEHIPQKSEAILWGFSMGGGIICQFLKTADADSLPAQVCLINTYFDLPMLVRDIFPLPGVSSVMKTNWNASNGLERYCSAKRASGGANVLIIAALDDELIPIKHAHLLLKSITDDCTKRELVVLPNGQHNNSVETHTNLWLPSLLPAVEPTAQATEQPTTAQKDT